MVKRFASLIRPSGGVVRGRPHFVAGPPAGPRGVVAWIPEGRVVTRAGWRRIEPVAIIELHATGVRRRPRRPRWLWRLAGLGLGIVLGLSIRWLGRQGEGIKKRDK
jgi:hypothetical protein